MRHAHNGVAALVPPFPPGLLSITTSYQGEPARAATSGTMRPSIAWGLIEETFTVCQAGRGNFSLTPPPLEPPLSARRPSPFFQVSSFTMAPPATLNCVPPTPST